MSKKLNTNRPTNPWAPTPGPDDDDPINDAVTAPVTKIRAEFIAVPEGHPTFWDASSEDRKKFPLTDGLLHYFPDALAAVAYVSWLGNQKHNPGEELHWSQSKSSDHLNCVGRHLTQAGFLDDDGLPHSWRLAWRALANLQMEMQALGAPLPPRATED